jgi:hypothetical protein
MLVIADAESPVGLAGVMGGANSEITEVTTAIVFESATFSGPSVRHTAIELGMRTDASSRFEKGLDPLGTLPAVERACELVELLGCGEVIDGVVDAIARSAQPVTLRLEPQRSTPVGNRRLKTQDDRHSGSFGLYRFRRRYDLSPLLAQRRGTLLRHRRGSGAFLRI